MPHSHAVVWMDFREAHVFRFGVEDVQKQRLKARNPYRKVHHKAGAIGGGHAHSDRAFFDETVEALAGVTEWLLVGPGVAKHDFLRHVGGHAQDLKAKLAAVETMDHPTDRELVDQARHFFKAFDKMQPYVPVRAG
ncbi:translational machinery protein [Reyranella sp.]|uniref:translational machinery protein n=1 Tax=Reyranella sp. TaxID=1929291 RepID=UPI003D0D7B8A